ncbi:MAG: tRNA lysidine(34) synthetase TilS [Rhizobiales bacterium]|nr:tRNA lysidine(34) synthetase TilS [Hyphomicrobiales bacterium]
MTRLSGPAADRAGLDPERLFRRLAGAPGLILAVSGGPDSTALMLLMAGWSARPPLLVVSFDHGLRLEAVDEARLVAANATRLGLACRVMRAAARPSGGNLQDWARRARYKCLAAAAREAGFDTVVTAHHQEDQAETFLLRLARGSGVYGLGGMAEEATVDGLRLARPLLTVSRRDLADVAEASGLPVSDDPSNRDPRFARVRMRALLPALAEHGLTPARLAGTAARLARAAAALHYYAETLLRDDFTSDPHGVVRGPTAALAAAPEEVGLRALALLLAAVGGAHHTPRLDRLEALRDGILAAGAEDRFRRTLHGCIVNLAAGGLTARREWGRSGLAAIPAAAGVGVVWDRRFRVEIPIVAGSLTVGPLGRSGRRLDAAARSAGRDRASIQVLPGLYDGARLIAAPEIVAAVDGGEALSVLEADCVVGRRLGLHPVNVAPRN